MASVLLVCCVGLKRVLCVGLCLDVRHARHALVTYRGRALWPGGQPLLVRGRGSASVTGLGLDRLDLVGGLLHHRQVVLVDEAVPGVEAGLAAGVGW